MFSACGGIRTLVVGKGGLFVAPPLEECLTWQTGSSTRAGTGRTDFQLIGSSVADCQALTLHKTFNIVHHELPVHIWIGTFQERVVETSNVCH